MSPEAIHSLIEMFGVEKGVQIMNLFTATDEAHRRKAVPPPLQPLRSRRRIETPARRESIGA